MAEYGIAPAAKAGALPKGSEGWFYMPHQGGLGVSGIPDFVGHYKGMFWAIEAKAPGKTPSGFQALQIAAIKVTEGAVFVVDGPVSLSDFKAWLVSTKMIQDGELF